MVTDAQVPPIGVALPAGHQVLCYEIKSILGQGGFGITYLAHDTNLHRDIALKEYLPRTWATRQPGYNVAPIDNECVELYNKGLSSFMTEARTLAKFKHPNVVQVLMVFEQHDTAYIAMEYEQGGSLSDLLKSGEFLVTEESLRKTLFPIMEGLQKVHDMGFLHRDIKPSNIYLREDESPVLIDFGSSRQTGLLNTSDVTVLITQGYTPTEQYSKGFGKQGPWTDIYSLAASLYHMISGQVVVDALQRHAAVHSGAPDPFKPLRSFATSAFSDRFILAIDRALALQPGDRPQTLSAWQALFEPEPEPESKGEEEGVTEVNLLVGATADDDATVLLSPVTDNAAKDNAAKDNKGTIPPTGNEPGNEPGDKPEPDRSIPENDNTTQKAKEHKQPATNNKGATAGKNSTIKYAILGAAAVAIGVGAFSYYSSTGQKSPDDAIDVSIDRNNSLPGPDIAIEISSPIDKLTVEVESLLAQLDGYQNAPDKSSPQTLANIKALGENFTALAQSSVVKTNRKLSDAVADGLVKSVGVTAQTQGLVVNLISGNSAITEEKLQSLLSADSLSREERETLVFGIASASEEVRSSIQQNPAFDKLLAQFRNSIKYTIEARNFSLAARMTEIALLLQPDDKELIDLGSHLSQKE